jgi:hypothetical protein
MVDPCHFSKYDLGFPVGLLADGFFRSAYMPVCYTRSKYTCATFFSAPLQLLLVMISNDDCQAEFDSKIPKQELNDAIRMFLHDELHSVVVVQWWRNKIAATNIKRIVSNVREYGSSCRREFSLQSNNQSRRECAPSRLVLKKGWCGIIKYQLLPVMIGVIAACWVIKQLGNAIQDHARRDHHQQLCHGQVARVSDKGDDSLPNDDDSRNDDDSHVDYPSSLISVHDNNSNGAVSTSDDGSGQDETSSDRPPEDQVVERKHATVNRKSSGKPLKKILHGNILSCVSRNRKVDEDEEVSKAALPHCAWSQVACADTSRPYVRGGLRR